ncbi:hydroxymethylbilane synthase [Actinomadura sp. NPDC048955]|uniref:Porphobilinogen deaminase n=1 Tax=Actinomadura luteofluorescens TaxID=46163 RepID=A0A7Y9JHF2_9ACTN|nr:MULTISPECIES: hydroxymethylbilane synthase [Actinomadura]MCR3744646.1 hydroxymethylbilane synthase [Actinomadura glauciflava]NYD48985.1 hydroxymethylbilane synthase [Actinomadura luteofluorescens]
MSTGSRGPLRLGTRKSLMATTQSQGVADALSRLTGHAVELVGVTTQGDVSKALLAQIGGTGVFVNALRDKVLSGEVDFAVHSLKDLPTSETPGIALAATPARDDARDALCGPAKLADLPRGARIGTGSPRRVAQLRALRPDLEIVPIRGNADTRLRKVTDGELDAVVLAHAGLKRIGRLDAVSEVFDPDQMLPAPGQGSLALECRADRDDLRALLGTIDDAPTRRAVTAERTVLAVLEAGCSAPVGTYAAEVDERLHLTATVAAYDGSRQVRLSASGHPDAAEQLGRDLADRLLAQGADQLMGERE